MNLSHFGTFCQRRAAVAVLLFVASAAAAACGAAKGSTPSQSRQQPSAQTQAQANAGYHGALLSPPVPKPEFTLTDTSSTAFDLQKETEGDLTLLYFGYTHCPDVCPTHMATIATALKQMPASAASQVKVVFVTTDPRRDTPEVLRQWLDHFDQRFIGLTGSQATIELAERTTGVPAAKQEPTSGGDYGVDHAGFVIVYTPDNLAHLIYPEGVTPDGWAQDLTKLAKTGWSGG